MEDKTLLGDEGRLTGGEALLTYEPRVYITDLVDPEEGRVFVWAGARWYERVSGEAGDVAFPHVADTEEELHAYLGNPGLVEALVEADDGDFARLVVDEFKDLPPLYPEAPESSDEPPFEEQQAA